jgi:hypothetical protein
MGTKWRLLMETWRHRKLIEDRLTWETLEGGSSRTDDFVNFLF